MHRYMHTLDQGDISVMKEWKGGGPSTGVSLIKYAFSFAVQTFLLLIVGASVRQLVRKNASKCDITKRREPETFTLFKLTALMLINTPKYLIVLETKSVYW